MLLFHKKCPKAKPWGGRIHDGLLPNGAVVAPILGVADQHGRVVLDRSNPVVTFHYVAMKAMSAVVVVLPVIELDAQVGAGDIVISSHDFTFFLQCSPIEKRCFPMG